MPRDLFYNNLELIIIYIENNDKRKMLKVVKDICASA